MSSFRVYQILPLLVSLSPACSNSPGGSNDTGLGTMAGATTTTTSSGGTSTATTTTTNTAGTQGMTTNTTGGASGTTTNVGGQSSSSTGATQTGTNAGGANGGATSLGASGATMQAVGGQGSGGSPADDRGPTPPSDTANFPFPQNRERPNCTYPTSYTNQDVRDLYEAWKSDLVTSDGAGGFRRVARVAEPGLQPNSTVSEGIAYGMLASVYMDDQELFDDLWRYALQYTWTYQEPSPGNATEPTLLMEWYIHADGNVSPGGGDDPAGNGAATDADEDIAFALVMADRQWGGGGSLDRSYIDYARELIDDIWAFEIADERLPKNGSNWGSDTSLNISYFAPAYYRVFARVTGDMRWSTNVVDYIYTVINNNLNGSNGNENNGLVPAWSQSNGSPAEVGPGENPLPFHYQYDSCRTPFRIGQDACWNGDSRARDYLAKVIPFFNGIGAPNIVDGYELDGTPRPEFPESFGGLSGAFIGPAAVGAMHDSTFSGFLDEAYGLVRQNNMWAGGQYYDESWHLLSILMLTGNFLDFTQYD